MSAVKTALPMFHSNYSPSLAEGVGGGSYHRITKDSNRHCERSQERVAINKQRIPIHRAFKDGGMLWLCLAMTLESFVMLRRSRNISMGFLQLEILHSLARVQNDKIMTIETSEEVRLKPHLHSRAIENVCDSKESPMPHIPRA